MPQVPRHSEPLEIVIPAAISDTVRSIAKAILLVDGEVHSEIQLTREGESFHGRFDPLFCDRPWPRGCNVEIRVVAEVDLDDGTGYDVPLEDIKGQVALPGRWTISFIGALLLLLLAYLLLHLLFKSLGKWLRTKLIKDVLPKLEKGQSPVPVRFQQPFLVYLRSLELHTVHAQLQNVQSGEFSPADKKDKLASIGEELSSLMQKSKEELDNLAMNPSEHSRAGLSAAYFAAFLEEDVVKALDWARQLADHVGNDERVAAALCLNHLCRTGNWEHYYTLEAEKRFATDIIDSAGQAYSARIAT